MTNYPLKGKIQQLTSAQVEGRSGTPTYYDPLKGKPLYLTPAQVSERCGISTQALELWRRQGNGPRYVRISCRKVLYSLEELTAWLDARTVRSTSDPLSPEI